MFPFGDPADLTQFHANEAKHIASRRAMPEKSEKFGGCI
jgi:hypothetical protein